MPTMDSSLSVENDDVEHVGQASRAPRAVSPIKGRKVAASVAPEQRGATVTEWTDDLRGRSLKEFLRANEETAEAGWWRQSRRGQGGQEHWPWWHVDILQSPDGMQRRLWDLLIVVLVLTLFAILPFESLVTFFYPDKAYKVFNYVMDGIFWVDIVINFNASFYHGTELVTDRREIIEHYVWGNPLTHNTGWFWVDLVGNFPFEVIASAGVDKNQRKSAKALKLLKLPKLLRIGRLLKYMGQYVTFAMFMKHCLITAIFIHVMSCWYVGSYYSDVVCHKLYADDVSNDCSFTFLEAYLEAITSVVALVLGGTATVDAVPDNETGRYNEPLHLVVTSVGTLLYWLLLADIIVVMQNSTNAYTAHRVSLDRAKQELEYFELPEKLKVKVRALMEYQWKSMIPSKCSLLTDESLSPLLRQEVVLHFHGENLRNTALFSGCSDGCIAAAAMKLKTVVIRRHDPIIKQGELGRELYLLSRGTCIVAKGDTILALIKQGHFFGETALVSKTSPYRTVDVLALTWCELQRLDQADFRSLCAEYPDVLTNAEMMMKLLEQDSSDSAILWEQYLAEKNKIFGEALREASGEVGLPGRRPSSMVATKLYNGRVEKNMHVDDIVDFHRGVHPIYQKKKALLEARVLSGEFAREVKRRTSSHQGFADTKPTKLGALPPISGDVTIAEGGDG